MNLFKISIIFIFFFNASSNGQSQLTGRMYKAEISASCKEMSDGGCMIYSYCILEFKKNIVTVSYSTKAYCSPEEKEGNYNRNHSEKMQYGYSI